VFALLKAIHFLALAFGAAASLGNIYLMLARGPHDLPDPGRHNELRKLYRLTALAAIALLWITGLLLLVFGHGGWVSGPAFASKIALVLVLTAIVVLLNLMAPYWARRGGPPGWIPAVHLTGAASLLAVVALAAFAFG
jgi:cytochrome b subunit of formate dehydrogenase